MTLSLTTLLSQIPGMTLEKGETTQFLSGVSEDSRKITQNTLFVAVAGTKKNGSEFIAAALKNGATALLLDDTTQTPEVPKNISILRHPNVRLALAKLARAFYPQLPKHCVAVTGTNGKTSTVHFFKSLCEQAGFKAATIGTLGITGGSTETLTTPSPVELHQELSRLASEGYTHVALEASSIGLDQERLSGLSFSAAAFTNLTQDHLDYHGSMELYFNAKLKLFSERVEEGAFAVLNADSVYSPRISSVCEKRNLKILEYGMNGNGLKLSKLDILPQGLGMSILLPDGELCQATVPVVGNFQAENILAAFGLALASGIPAKTLVKTLSSLRAPPGRLESVLGEDAPAVFVDYAHTPDALEKALAVLRNHTKGKLGVVFGCGGNRDKGKRPLMGHIASRLADWVIVTDDNPRDEDPKTIRNEILIACKNAEDIGARDEAIKKAINKLESSDILLIAGKGHEKSQIIGKTILPWDDVAFARTILSNTQK